MLKAALTAIRVNTAGYNTMSAQYPQIPQIAQIGCA